MGFFSKKDAKSVPDPDDVPEEGDTETFQDVVDRHGKIINHETDAGIVMVCCPQHGWYYPDQEDHTGH